MKATPLSNCERRFLLRAIQEKKRLDGRQCYDYRNIRVSFGADRGCCMVELGRTRVLAQVSCELVPPKPSRPTEGVLFFNLELSPMAAPGLEPGRQSELLVSLNRLLERCLRDSKCIETESLCVVAGEKVWQIRLDMHLLNHDGNITDAASIAGIVALCHFRRPDVSVQGEEVTVYTPEERDPVPLSIHHMPICVSFAFFHQGTYLLVDPTEREERVMDGLLVIAMNKHHEICTIQSSGVVMLLPDQILRCTKITAVKVAEITELIQKALENDQKARKEGGKFGFAESIPNQRITAFKMESAAVDTNDVEEQAGEIIAKADPPSEVFANPVLHTQNFTSKHQGFLNSCSFANPVLHTPGTAQIGEGIDSSWGDLEESEKEEAAEEEGESEAAAFECEKVETEDTSTLRETKSDEPIVLSDSEEEEVVILEPQELPRKTRTQTSSKQENPSKKAFNKRRRKKRTSR
uniref:exosome complex component RRP45 isoform X1 n=1 Tax=Lonchura striata TaxID=40157 RepID=UPI000B4D592B|nr:exosome complex component RRP45 isoform X1 [Lonchura striata domestica]